MTTAAELAAKLRWHAADKFGLVSHRRLRDDPPLSQVTIWGLSPIRAGLRRVLRRPLSRTVIDGIQETTRIRPRVLGPARVIARHEMAEELVDAPARRRREKLRARVATNRRERRIVWALGPLLALVAGGLYTQLLLWFVPETWVGQTWAWWVPLIAGAVVIGLSVNHIPWALLRRDRRRQAARRRRHLGLRGVGIDAEKPPTATSS